MELPRVFLVINEANTDKSGVDFIAAVDHPAIEEGYIAFSNKKLSKVKITLGSDKGNFTPTQPDKMILAGPLMIPDMDIFRIDPDGKEYNVQFTRDTIEQIQRKFKRLNYNNNINEMHDPAKKIQGAYLFQDFIIDREAGIMPPFNMNHLPDGTWFGFVKVDNPTVWNEYIKTGIYTGFSVEGNFYEEPQTALSAEEMSILESIL